MTDTPRSGEPPYWYRKLPMGLRCRCINLWQDGDTYYCCRAASAAAMIDHMQIQPTPDRVAEDRAFKRGFAIALAEIIRTHDEPSIVRDVLDDAGMTMETMQLAGVEDYDLNELRKAYDL